MQPWRFCIRNKNKREEKEDYIRKTEEERV